MINICIRKIRRHAYRGWRRGGSRRLLKMSMQNEASMFDGSKQNKRHCRVIPLEQASVQALGFPASTIHSHPRSIMNKSRPMLNLNNANLPLGALSLAPGSPVHMPFRQVQSPHQTSHLLTTPAEHKAISAITNRCWARTSIPLTVGAGVSVGGGAGTHDTRARRCITGVKDAAPSSEYANRLRYSAGSALEPFAAHTFRLFANASAPNGIT